MLDRGLLHIIGLFLRSGLTFLKVQQSMKVYLKAYFTLRSSHTYKSTTKSAKSYEGLKHMNRLATK